MTVRHYNKLRSFLLAGAVTFAGFSYTLFAQDFDDIYYNPAKEKTKTVTTTKKTVTAEKQTPSSGTYVPTPDYSAADTYSFDTGSMRDVDEYNRRTATTDYSQTTDSLADSDEFAYTRRIERFHNPDVVVDTNDDDLIEYYYSTEPESPSVVNIYIDNNPLWMWNRPYVYSSWSWAPYYSSWWGPSWSLGWWGPSWSWGWYDPWYSWSWTWGPSYGWGYPHPWHPGPRPGSWANWRPNPVSPGATRPHAWAGGNGMANTRPAQNATHGNGGTVSGRPAQNGSMAAGTTTLRPGSTRGRYTASSNTSSDSPRWPASVNGTTTTNGNVSRPASTATSTRGRTVSSASNQPTRNINVNTTPQQTSSPSRNSFSGSSTRSSVGSSGGFRTGGTSGGSSGARGRR